MGHPIGPTGAGQIAEITRQLRGEAGVRQLEREIAALARKMVASGRYLWNAGIFLFRAGDYLRELEKYRPGNAEGQQGPHYYKGQIGRFRQSYSAEEQQILAARLGSYLSKMGYAV